MWASTTITKQTNGHFIKELATYSQAVKRIRKWMALPIYRMLLLLAVDDL